LAAAVTYGSFSSAPAALSQFHLVFAAIILSFFSSLLQVQPPLMASLSPLNLAPSRAAASFFFYPLVVAFVSYLCNGTFHNTNL
jgi:hypothetical protein